MNFQQSFTTCMSKYVDFSGRASRSEYWWFILAELVALIVAYMVHPIAYGIVALVFFLPALAAAVRRMHDVGRSGWVLLLSLIPLVGLVVLYWAIQPSQAEANAYGEPPALI